MKKYLFVSFLTIIAQYTTLPNLFAQTQTIPIFIGNRIPVILDQDVNISIFGLKYYDELVGYENYFLDNKGQTAILTAYNFFRIFILADIQLMKQYLVNPNDKRHHINNDTYNILKYELADVLYLNLQLLSLISKNEIKVWFVYGIQYNEFQPNFTMVITLIYIENEWKIKRYIYERS